MLLNDLIPTSIAVARKNWATWRAVYEHDASTSTNPLLADRDRFARFLREYAVARTVRKGTQDAFRRMLIERISGAIRDGMGQDIDSLERELRPKFESHDGSRRMISVVSKVAALLKPERFVAWDNSGP